MPMINIDNVDYDLDSLGDQAKAQIASLQAVERRIALLQEELAIHHTARSAYATVLKRLLDARNEGSSDTPIPQVSWPS